MRVQTDGERTGRTLVGVRAIGVAGAWTAVPDASSRQPPGPFTSDTPIG